MSSRYADLVTETEFYLTDEHDNDNTQEGLLLIQDACEGLRHYVTRLSEGLDTLDQTNKVETRVSINADLVQISQAYDKELEKALFVINDSLRELDRRLDEAATWRQVNRPMGRLPKRANPPPLRDGDPRLGKKGAV